jgi:hypothetical protein
MSISPTIGSLLPSTSSQSAQTSQSTQSSGQDFSQLLSQVMESGKKHHHHMGSPATNTQGSTPGSTDSAANSSSSGSVLSALAGMEE